MNQNRLNTFNSFVELNEAIEFLNSSLNEGIINKENIESIFSEILDRAKKLKEINKKKFIGYAIISLLAASSIDKISNLFDNTASANSIELKMAKDIYKNLGFQDPTKMRVSSDGIKMIKKTEKLKLIAYDIGDGKITVGYGHAEDKSKSKYRKGQKIDIETANELFKRDLTRTADGVRRIFSEWKEKGINVKIDQNMFNSLVSIAFNMGISGLRETDLIQYIKKGEFKKAGELIRVTGLDDKFPGLESRREEESDKFLSFLKEIRA